MTSRGAPGFAPFYRGRRVLVLGHTGFKGSWLCEWLLALGADVHGIGLPATSDTDLFAVLGLEGRVDHHELDITDRGGLQRLVAQLRPEIVFHLAAQSLVRRSYREPLTTLDTNVTGTANLLAAIGAAGYTPEAPCAVVVVTSDKCYQLDAGGTPCREEQAMGGSDLYSASKGMVELLAAAWRQSFFAVRSGAPAIRLATARAGNVLGGGDRAADRIAVDCMRALANGHPLQVRHPAARRPWQHVLEPLSGYLLLGERLARDPRGCESGWNFGPGPAGERTVAQLCDAFLAAWGSGRWQAHCDADDLPETHVLRLSIVKAQQQLGWQPTWDFDTMIEHVVAWYRTAHQCGHDRTTMTALTQQQITTFTAALHADLPPPQRRRPTSTSLGVRA